MANDYSAAVAKAQHTVGELRTLSQRVYQRLVGQGLLAATSDFIPQIEVLREIIRYIEPARSAFLTELKTVTFMVATSHRIKVRWERREYRCGPEAQAFTLPVAINILEYADQFNKNIRTRQTKAQAKGQLDDASMTDKPIMVYWDSFLDAEGQRVNNPVPNTVFGGITYKKTYDVYRNRSVYDDQMKAATRGDVDALFTPDKPVTPSVEKQYTTAAPAGTPYEELAGSLSTSRKPILNQDQVQGIFQPSEQPAPPPPPPPAG